MERDDNGQWQQQLCEEYEYFSKLYDQGLLDEEYGEYIMNHSDRPICNGDMLIGAMESHHLLDDFIESKALANMKGEAK